MLASALLLALACGEESEPPEVETIEPEPTAAADTVPATPVFRRGMWVLCQGSQRVLEHPDRIPMLIDDALALGVTDLFVQVYRGGRAWFDSSLADPSPYKKIVDAHGGTLSVQSREKEGTEFVLRLIRDTESGQTAPD